KEYVVLQVSDGCVGRDEVRQREVVQIDDGGNVGAQNTVGIEAGGSPAIKETIPISKSTKLVLNNRFEEISHAGPSHMILRQPGNPKVCVRNVAVKGCQ